MLSKLNFYVIPPPHGHRMNSTPGMENMLKHVGICNPFQRVWGYQPSISIEDCQPAIHSRAMR